MVVDVAEEKVKVVIDELSGVALQVHADITGVHDNTAQLDEAALEIENPLQSFRGRLVENDVFHPVDTIIHRVDGLKVRIDDGIENQIKNAVGRSIRAGAQGSFHRFANGLTPHISHRDAEFLANEQRQGRGLELLLGFDKVQGLENDEEISLTLFDLDARFRVAGVLN